MILDHLDNAILYNGLSSRIAAALDFLKRSDLRQRPDGRYELDGDRLFALVQRYQPKPQAEARWEAHRRYIDVQYVVSGAERMGFAPLVKGLPVSEPYDAEKDIVFYDARGDFLTVSAGQFAIFFPQDVHAPQIALDGKQAAQVCKVVMKCRVEQ